MKRRTAWLVVAVVLGSLIAGVGSSLARDTRRTEYTDRFFEEDCQFTTEGRNPYFILEPGYTLILGGRTPDGEVRLTIAVTDETRNVAGFETRVVEERETVDGGLVEVSRNFVAICEQTGSVFYFGEAVDNYEGTEIVDHDGSWLAGQRDARPGVLMPGTVLLGARYYQEIAPGVALDRAEIVSLGRDIRTPAGQFADVLTTRETTPLEPDARETKRYARGVGLVQDAELMVLQIVRSDDAARR